MLTKSSTELVRQQNSMLVLSALRRHGRLAHTEISDQTRLASATVSAITAELERAHLIERTEVQPVGGRGRPRVLFEQRRDCAYLAVVVISSDAVQYSLVDYSGRLLDRFAELRPATAGADLFARTVRDGLDRLAGRTRIERNRILVISISSKGIVDPGRPVLVWSPVLGADRIDFADALRPDWQAEIMLANETLLVASALGTTMEKTGLHPGFRSLAALSLGHSIGLGIVSQTGTDHHVSALNFGHMLHMPDGALCRCGSRGCIEAYAGFYAVLRGAFEVPTDTIPAKFVPLTEMDKIAASARQGNRIAGFAFRQAGLALGNGLARMFSLHDRMPVVLTGPGTRYFDLLQKGMEEGLSQSQIVRLEGMPPLSVAADEQNLVFQGHLNRALAAIDRSVLGFRQSAAVAS
ncbi:MAG: transcriptional regulator [Rhizobium sp. 63-7]|nr:MAG: transcriptional regulator [Rhizobium sp. 63-7]